MLLTDISKAFYFHNLDFWGFSMTAINRIDSYIKNYNLKPYQKSQLEIFEKTYICENMYWGNVTNF